MTTLDLGADDFEATVADLDLDLDLELVLVVDAVAEPATSLEQLVTAVREPDVDKALAFGGAGKERSA